MEDWIGSLSIDRREFVRSAAAFGGAVAGTASLAAASGQREVTAEVELPRLRVPASFIIDDSTCLVNMGHYCMPQFAAAWPNRSIYKKPWQTWPREIPDSFVREFGEWCAEEGVKGKYSIVPYPACVGWLDRFLPGWSQQALRDSLKLVRDLMLPNWDIHPEMITHTRVIDLKTGRPIREINAGTMENSFPQRSVSVDELASYLAYALQIVKNCELPCEGITTPGGFGGRVKKELSLAVFDAVRDVYGCELPHYFKYVAGPQESTVPRIENVGGGDGEPGRVTASVWAGTGDWFGGWDGDREPEPDRYANRDASAGRMVELIEKREPAVMLCHWPGLYSHGTKQGLHAFQRVIRSLHQRYRDDMLWMKVSEIGRYYTVKELARVAVRRRSVTIDSPFGTRWFTLRIGGKSARPKVRRGNDVFELTRVSEVRGLDEGRYCEQPDGIVVCFRLERGVTTVLL